MESIGADYAALRVVPVSRKSLEAGIPAGCNLVVAFQSGGVASLTTGQLLASLRLGRMDDGRRTNAIGLLWVAWVN